TSATCSPSSGSPTERKPRSTSSAPAAGLRTNCLWRLGPCSAYGESMPMGIVTGASRGLGRVLAQELARRDWQLVVDARGAELLRRSWARVAGRGNHPRRLPHPPPPPPP